MNYEAQEFKELIQELIEELELVMKTAPGTPGYAKVRDNARKTIKEAKERLAEEV